MGKLLTSAEMILQAEDFVYDEVDCPEWGGAVRIRSLSGGQRVELRKAVDSGRNDIDEMLCVMAIVDEDGNRVLHQNQMGALGKKNTAVITRIANRVLEISGMKDRDKAIADAEKNSDGMESVGSSFD